MSETLESVRKPGQSLLWVPVAICLLAFFARIIPGPRTIDDAYITFRYARNILAGLGFVYNPGERVLGTTTFLYTLVMALLGKITGQVIIPFPSIALTVNAFADALSCFLLFLLGLKFGNLRVAVGVALIWAIAPFSVTFAIGGLETSLFVLISLAAVYFHISDRHILASFSAAMAILTRPDALILVIPLALDRLWQSLHLDPSPLPSQNAFLSRIFRSFSALKVEILVFMVPVISWLVFSISYFGSFLPQSMAAKTLAYQLQPLSALIRLLQHYTTPFLEHLSFGTRWIVIGIILYPFLYLVGSVQSFRAKSNIWPFIIYPWLYFILYAWVNPLIFRWYLTPPLPALFLFILIGADHIVFRAAVYFSNVLRRNPSDRIETNNDVRFARLVAALAVIILPVCSSLRGWTLRPDHGLPRPAPEMAWYKLELLYQEAASFLEPYLNSASGTPSTVAAGDVGVLGYYTGAPILDTVGLNSPVSLKYYPLEQKYYTINYAIPPDLIMDEAPDYLVFLEVYGREGLMQNKRFQDHYTLMHTFSTDIYGSQGLLVMKRK